MEHSPFPGSTDDFQSGLSFDQIATFARRHVVSIVGATVVGVVVGIGGALVLPKEWQARTVLQVGQVARSGMAAFVDSGVSVPIELPARTVERLKLPQFEDEVLRKLGLPLSRFESDKTALFRDYVTIGLVRNADLISVSARGYSEDEARRFVEAYQAHLIEVHRDLLQPSVDRASAELAQAKAALELLRQRRVELEAVAAKRPAHVEARFSENVLLGNLLQTNDDEIRKLQTRIQVLQEDLSSSRTFNTRPLMTSVEVSDRPVFPRKSVFAGLGALIGLAVGLGLGVLGDWRKRKGAAMAR